MSADDPGTYLTEEIPEPVSRPQRRTHLDASVVPVERALLSRAAQLSRRATAMPPGPEADTLLAISAEFLALSEALHWH